jgi:hypothetical protein
MVSIAARAENFCSLGETCRPVPLRIEVCHLQRATRTAVAREPRDHAAEGAAARMNRKLRTPTDPLSSVIKPTSLNNEATSRRSKWRGL